MFDQYLPAAHSLSVFVVYTRDKYSPKLYSSANNMNPGVVPPQLMVYFYTSAIPLLYYGLSLFLRSSALCHLGSTQVKEMLDLAVMPIISIYQLSMDTVDMSSTSLRMSPHFPTVFLDYLPN